MTAKALPKHLRTGTTRDLGFGDGAFGIAIFGMIWTCPTPNVLPVTTIRKTVVVDPNVYLR